jgi:hypothetical protein
MMQMVKFPNASRVDRQLAWIVFALALALYWRMLAPGLLDGDSGEFQTAAWRWGLAHATGYPLYLLLGGVWQRGLALVGIAPATALNALSAVIGALTVALLYRLMLGWLPGADLPRRLAALFTAALFAVNPTFWSQNLIAEVYALHALFVVLILQRYQQVEHERARSARSLIALALAIGLALTHHAMTLLLLPPLLLALTLIDRGGWRRGRLLVGMALAGLLPLVLYLYIPLRSGEDASPWLHQRLGAGELTLYEPSWQGFVDFVTGRSISVGFYRWDEALAYLPQAWTLWRLHFTWTGLVLLIAGLYALWRRRTWPLFSLTVGYALLQQIFNLFYAIGDILVYYIPLYLMGAIWCGIAVHGLAVSFSPPPAAPDTAAEPPSAPAAAPGISLGVIAALACFLLPFWLLRDYSVRLDQTDAVAARQMWAAIEAADPPAEAILISNDRNEIVPLFYLQAVEGKLLGRTGLFPLMQPGPAFADIGATVETALQQGAGQPVYLIKPMPGLETKFQLTVATPPLVQVEGPAARQPPAQEVDAPFGPLRLLGYDWQVLTDTVEIVLHWSVVDPLPADYTTTVQLFDAPGNKVAQSDQPPGGRYYPTSLWKPGERLVERHRLTLPAESQPTKLLVGMYQGAALTPLAPSLELELPPAV